MCTIIKRYYPIFKNPYGVGTRIIHRPHNFVNNSPKTTYTIVEVGVTTQ